MRTWHSAVILAMKEAGTKRVHLQEIYDAVGHYRELTGHDIEPHPRHGQQNFKHTVRSCLAALQKHGLVEYLGKAIYSLMSIALEHIHYFESDSAGKTGGSSEEDIADLIKSLSAIKPAE